MRGEAHGGVVSASRLSEDCVGQSDAMAILHKIEVRIRSDGDILTEYDDPDKDLSREAKTVTKLIKATPGAKFHFEVLLLPGYDFQGADCVYVSQYMDRLHCNSLSIGKRSCGSSITHTLRTHINSDTHFDDESGQ